MATYICGTCKYFRRDNSAGGGECRRRAPGPTGWPFTTPVDWCGDHSAFEAEETADPTPSPPKLDRTPPRLGRMAEIATPMAASAGLTLADLRSPARHRHIAHVRQDVMRAIHENTKASLPEIGRFLNRDHTTVMWGIRKSREREQKRLLLIAPE